MSIATYEKLLAYKEEEVGILRVYNLAVLPNPIGSTKYKFFTVAYIIRDSCEIKGLNVESKITIADISAIVKALPAYIITMTWTHKGKLVRLNLERLRSRCKN